MANTLIQKTMTVHLYALCWNEEFIIPYFLRHYDDWVDNIFIFDDGSNDKSKELLEKNPKVAFKTTIEYRDEGHDQVNYSNFYNQVWKKSRGIADWVILCNLDEHFFFNGDIRDYLIQCKAKGVTYIPSRGYDMVGGLPKTAMEPLFLSLKKGTRRYDFDKTFAFNPIDIEESMFLGGRHQALPKGNIVFPEKIGIKLLHYKYIGFFNFLKKEGRKKTRSALYNKASIVNALVYFRKLITAKKVI